MVHICICTLIPANIEIPKDGLENGAVTNDDGHGFAIASTSLGIERFGSMKFDETMEALLDARFRHGPGSVVLFHSRFGTHGVLGEFNVHPFWVGEGEDTVMAHNGILPSVYHPEKGDRRSDTRIFVDWVAPAFCDPESGVPSRRMGKRLSNMVGSSNKLVFLSVKSGKPRVRIVNAWLGEQEGGVWYSNSGYKWGRSRYSPSTGAGWQTRYPYSSSYWDDSDGWFKGEDGFYRQGLPAGPSAGVTCPKCKSGEVDEAAQLCLDCDFCLDCKEYLDGCLCWIPGRFGEKSYADDDMRTPTYGEVVESISKLVEIEDIADNGYVKVDGVWRYARSLIAESV